MNIDYDSRWVCKYGKHSWFILNYMYPHMDYIHYNMKYMDYKTTN